MGKEFEKIVCGGLRPLLQERGYEGRSPCTYVRDYGPTFGTVWLVLGTGSLKGRFMPRLSVGLAVVGPEVAVLSTDLHVLKSPETSAWYPWTVEGWNPAEVSRDLMTLGLPWLEKHTTLEHLSAVLEVRRRRSGEPPKPTWWPWSQGETRAKGVDSNSLRFLSHSREAQGRYAEALDVWREYVASLTALREDSKDYQRISARTADLQAKIAGTT